MAWILKATTNLKGMDALWSIIWTASTLVCLSSVFRLQRFTGHWIDRVQTHQGQKGVNAELDKRRYILADLVGRANLDKSLSYLALFGCEVVLSTYGINILNHLFAELRTQTKVKQ